MSMSVKQKMTQVSTQSMTQDTPALVYGFSVTPDGVASAIDWQALSRSGAEVSGRWQWIHLNRLSAEAQQWLAHHGAPDEQVLSALLQPDTRPRIVRHEQGWLLNLRGVNQNPGASPEDMVSIRMWATRRCVITTSAHRILAAEDVRDQFLSADPPLDSGNLIALLARQLVNRITPVIADLDDHIDELEEQLLDLSAATSRTGISSFRRTVLSLRRYMAPQREAIAGFLRESEDFLAVDDRHSLRDTQDALVRLLEDLDLIRERALLLQEQLVEERAEAMNDRLFVLSMISVIFLPLSFLTGLFGVNIGGMPGMHSSIAFTVLCIVMVVFAIFVVWMFRRLKWL